MATSTLTVKQGDTFTVWTGMLGNDNGWIDLTSLTTIKMVGKLSGGSTLVGPVIMTKRTNQSFTANLTSGSNVLQSVSAFTNLSEGSTIVGAGIPQLAIIGALDTSANTITLTDTSGAPLNVTKTATGETLTGNQGMADYTPLTADTATAGVFNCEFGLHWGTALQVIPNNAANNPTLTIDVALDLGSE